jgi:uncharacterized LabA/DUF88 family protein
LPTANLYVDGLNLYNGCLKGTAFKWLDLEALAAALVPGRHVHRVRYFTARLAGAKARRQDVYLRALRGLSKVTLHTEGQFRANTVIRPVSDLPAAGMASVIEYQQGVGWAALPRPKPGRRLRVSIRDWKEKGTDVNLATMLLVDAYAHDADEAIVVSGDSDLEMPVRMAAVLLPVTVVNPVAGRRSKELQAAATAYTTLSPAPLAASQLPQVVKLPAGKQVTKPIGW